MVVHGVLLLAGYYQADPGQPSCDICPPGKYCDPHELANVTGIIYPEDCPVGNYCPAQTEYSTQNPCPPGTFVNTTQRAGESKNYNFNNSNINSTMPCYII